MTKLGYPVLLDAMGGLKKEIPLKNNSIAKFLKWSNYNGWKTAIYSVECPVCHIDNEFRINYYVIEKEVEDTHPSTVHEFQDLNQWFEHSTCCEYCGVRYLPQVK